MRTTLSVPTPEMYNGDFSNWVDSQGRLIVIYDPATTRPNPERNRLHQGSVPRQQDSRQPVQRRREAIPRARADRRSCRIARASCRERSATCRTTSSLPAARRRRRPHKFSVKIDHALSGAHRLAYLFNRTTNDAMPGDDGAAGLPGALQHVSNHRASMATCIAAAGTGSSGPRMVNHLSVGMNTFNKNAFSPNVDQNWRDKVCIPNAVDCNQNFGIISFSEFSTWGGSSYNGTEQPRFSIKDDLTISKGSHTIKAGFTFDRQQANGFGQQDIGGRAGFSFLETARARRDDAGQRRRQLVRVVPARRRGYRPDRDDSLSAAGLPVLRLLRAGRLADERQAGAQLRSALRVHAAAARRRRSVLRLFADQAESGRQRLSRRAGVCR